MQQLQRDAAVNSVCSPQSVANPLWACAKLRKQPSVDELQLLLQQFLQPAVLQEAKAQDLANLVWALGELSQLPGWQGGLGEQDMQQLCGKQQLVVLAGSENSQHTANVLLGLAKLAAGSAKSVGAVTVEFAHACSKQLLALVCDKIGSWEPQSITNAMWACGELGLADTPFVDAAVAAAPKWLPSGITTDVSLAALTCAALNRRDEPFMQVLMQRTQAFLLDEQQRRGQSRPDDKPRAGAGPPASASVASCCYAIAQLNMVQLAEAAKCLVVNSRVGAQQRSHPAELRRLWVLHSWLLQHQLLDGKGLTGVLTQQQLQQGAREAASHGA